MRIRVEMKSYNTISTEKLKKYQDYHLEKYDSTEILPPDQTRVIKRVEFAHSISGKVLEKLSKFIKDQRRKQLKVVKNNKKQI